MPAKQLAARLALEEISVKYNKQELLISDKKDVLQRIPPIVEKHISGIWNTQLEADYEETFNEQLPANWLEIINTLSSIKVVSYLGKKYILNSCKPGETFVSRVTGNEELYEASKSSEYLNSLNSKYVRERLEGSGEDSGHGSPSDPAISVDLHDMEGEVVINDQLQTVIGMELALPVLNKNFPTEVYVSYALDDGSVYIQVHSFGYDQLNSMLEELEQTMTNNKIDSLRRSFTPKNTKDKLFFAYYNADGHWYRAKIIDWSPDETHVQVFFVDYGNTSILKLSDKVLYSLADLNDVISKYPYQAKRVRMALSQIPANFADKVLRLMPNDQSVLVKVVKDDLEEPEVEFFKRSNNDFFSFNSALSAETE